MVSFFFFFFNDTATTEIYTLSLHDALPISIWLDRWKGSGPGEQGRGEVDAWFPDPLHAAGDRKSTRLNSSHGYISYAVFCLKKKNDNPDIMHERGRVHDLVQVTQVLACRVI